MHALPLAALLPTPLSLSHTLRTTLSLSLSLTRMPCCSPLRQTYTHIIALSLSHTHTSTLLLGRTTHTTCPYSLPESPTKRLLLPTASLRWPPPLTHTLVLTLSPSPSTLGGLPHPHPHPHLHPLSPSPYKRTRIAPVPHPRIRTLLLGTRPRHDSKVSKCTVGIHRMRARSSTSSPLEERPPTRLRYLPTTCPRPNALSPNR